MIEQQALSRRFSWFSFGLWVGLTLLGFLLSVVGHFPAGFASATFDAQDINLSGALTGFLFGAMSGLIIASLQWFVLKSWTPNARLWIPLNAVGFGLVHAVGDAVPYIPMVLVVGGIIVGLAQYIALRHALSRAIVWILIAAVAWFLGFQLGFALPGGAGGYNLVVAALTNGVITGLALRLLIAHNLAVPENLTLPTLISRWSNLNLFTRILLTLLFVVFIAVLVVFAGPLFGL